MMAVNLVAGRENPVIQTLWNHLPLERYEVVSPPVTTFDPNLLLPVGRGYFHYMGSLSTPPCSENVAWIVLKQSVEVSVEQIGIFARLHENNARPLQAASGRRIKESR
jgi:carbonic anhydrase